MKRLFFTLLACGQALSLCAAEESQFKSPTEKASYALGMNIGKQLRSINAELDYDVYLKALKEAVKGGKLLLTDAEATETVNNYVKDLRGKLNEKFKKEGDEFLVANKKKDGIVATPSGLQYKIETKGTGKTPGSNDTVLCHYRGTLINGEEFDSSYKKGEPVSFPVTRVIKGWTEALLLMPVGSKWKLFIPSDLAYGERGGRNIPPNSTLLFDIELVSIQDPSKLPPNQPPAQQLNPGLTQPPRLGTNRPAALGTNKIPPPPPAKQAK